MGGVQRGSSQGLEDTNNLANHGKMARQPAFRQIVDLHHSRPATRPAGTLLASETPLDLPQGGMRESRGFSRHPLKTQYSLFMSQSCSAAAARRIVGLSQRCLDYRDQILVVQPSLEGTKGKGSLRQYSFDDLLRLAVVKNLRQAGLSLQKIRKGLSAYESGRRRRIRFSPKS